MVFSLAGCMRDGEEVPNWDFDFEQEMTPELEGELQGKDSFVLFRSLSLSPSPPLSPSPSLPRSFSVWRE